MKWYTVLVATALLLDFIRWLISKLETFPDYLEPLEPVPWEPVPGYEDDEVTFRASTVTTKPGKVYWTAISTDTFFEEVAKPAFAQALTPLYLEELSWYEDAAMGDYCMTAIVLDERGEGWWFHRRILKRALQVTRTPVDFIWEDMHLWADIIKGKIEGVETPNDVGGNPEEDNEGPDRRAGQDLGDPVG